MPEVAGSGGGTFVPDTVNAAVDDTIAAQATAPGRAGIGVVRLSGPGAFGVVRQLLTLAETPPHAQARLAHLHDAGRLLDQVVVTCFHAPRSYTGEDVAEISTHGAPVVLDRLLDLALAAGARAAEPGEFSRRAFLNGRLDLLGVEAVHDLIAAQTLAQAHTAARQLAGGLAQRVKPVKDRLLHLIAMLEAGMDFASGELDDVEAMPPAAVLRALAELLTPLGSLLATYRTGAIARRGLRLALVGPPNAGKSSLFNALLGRERAIVTPIAGTTRDTLEETLEIYGIPIVLVDTAGLRDALHADPIEQLGMERSREALADADLVLLVTDGAEPSATQPGDLLQLTLGRPILSVLTKADLAAPEAQPQVAGATPQAAELTPHAREPAGAAPPLRTSVVTGEGLPELRSAILRWVRGDTAAADEAGLNTLRQRDAVAAAHDALVAAQRSTQTRQPHEIVLIDLHQALDSLDRLTGVTTTEDILTRIFSTFCIGK